MDIIETRRENLRRWTEANGIPVKEKSLFSQLKGTGSFGERVARRLEQQYRMGERYLDTPNAPVAVPPPVEANRSDLEEMLKLSIRTAEEMRVLVTYRHGGPDERAIIDSAVDVALAMIRDEARNEG